MAFSGMSLANFAIRCCFVETLSGPEFPGIFPSNGSVFRQPLGSDRSFGLVPRHHRYYELLRLPANRPAALRFLRLAVPPCALLSVSPEEVGTPSPGRGSLDRGFPNHCSDDGISRISQVPGVPPYPHALLSDPGGASTPDPCGASVPPSAITKASPPTMSLFRRSITRPVGSLCALRRVGLPSPRTTRFRLLVSLTGWDWYPLGTNGRFQVDYCILPPHPGFVWRTVIQKPHLPMARLDAEIEWYRKCAGRYGRSDACRPHR